MHTASVLLSLVSVYLPESFLIATGTHASDTTLKNTGKCTKSISPENTIWMAKRAE